MKSRYITYPIVIPKIKNSALHFSSPQTDVNLPRAASAGSAAAAAGASVEAVPPGASKKKAGAVQTNPRANRPAN